MPRALVASPKEARRDGPFHLRRQECRGARAAREGAWLRGKRGMPGLPRRAPGTTFFAAGHRELWVTGNTAQQFLRPCQPLKAWLASVGSSLSVKHGPTASTGSSRSKAVEQGSSPRRSKPPPPPNLRQAPNLPGNLPPHLRAHHDRDQIPASQSAPTVRAVSAIVPSLWSVSIWGLADPSRTPSGVSHIERRTRYQARRPSLRTGFAQVRSVCPIPIG